MIVRYVADGGAADRPRGRTRSDIRVDRERRDRRELEMRADQSRVAGEIFALLRVIGRSEEAARFWRPHQAGDRNVCVRARFAPHFRREFGWNEATIDDHIGARRKTERRQKQIAWAGMLGTGGRKENDRILIEVAARQFDMAVIVIERLQPGPIGNWRQIARRRVGARRDLGQQALFPGQPMQLPDAKPYENCARDQREQGRPQKLPQERLRRCHGARSGHILFLEPAFFGLVAILQRDQKTFRRPQQSYANHRRQRQKDDEMHPEGRLIDDLRPERRAEDDETGEEGHEDGRPVAGVDEVIIEMAGCAARCQLQQAGKQLAASATRAAAEEPSDIRRRRCRSIVAAHAISKRAEAISK
jgi:hypothetical protein